jgi:dTMP kinase
VPGIFITFEGGEGSGKTTQLKRLLAHLRSVGLDPVETRDPGGTAIGNQVRQLVLDGRNSRMADLTELFLYEASRTQLVAEVIRPAVAAGRTVVCDRFTDSTIAYQGYGRGMDLALIRQLNDLATGGLRPDLTFLLDLDPVAGLARVSERLVHLQASRDRLEGEALEFHQRVRSGYRALAGAEPSRIVPVDATQGIAEIEAQIRGRLAALLASGGVGTAAGRRAEG